MESKVEKRDLTWFQNLSTPEVAGIVREHGPRTLVFAAGGTTRWFILRYLDGWPEDSSYLQRYIERGRQQFMRIIRLFFDHGVRALFTHAVAPGQLEGRSEGYALTILTTAMKQLTEDPELLALYREYGVRVRFFGNYRQVLGDSRHRDALERFDDVEKQTRENNQYLLYWGFNSKEDQIAPLLQLAVDYYQVYGRMPSTEKMITLCYGEPVGLVDVFVGFNRPKDLNLIPPLLGGQADLYFLVGLSFDFSQLQLRSILYDHLYARKGRHRNYGELPADAFSEMQAFYRQNRGKILGLGRRYEPGAIWHPLPQVCLPPAWTEGEGV